MSSAEAKERAESFLRLARHHGGESGKYALQASLLLDEGKRDLAATVLMRGRTEQVLAEHYAQQAKEIIGEYGL
jgi:hypothetical protein